MDPITPRGTKRCGECFKRIEPGTQFVEAVDDHFHPECFVCAHCKKRFPGGKFVAHRGKAYCADDFEYMCSNCDKIIGSEGKFFTVNGKRVHDTCLKCHTCRKYLSNANYVLDNQVYCEEDYDLEKRTRLPTTPRGSSTQPTTPRGSAIQSTTPRGSAATTLSIPSANSNNNNNNNTLLSPRSATGAGASLVSPRGVVGICHGCNNGIEAGKVLKIASLGRQYHPACFTCEYCNKPLGPNASFGEHKRKIACNTCLEFMCPTCGYFIRDDHISLDNKKYHSTCLRCHDCQTALDYRDFYQLNNIPYCKDHYTKHKPK